LNYIQLTFARKRHSRAWKSDGVSHTISRVGNSGQRDWRKRSSKSKTCNIMLTRVCPCITEYNNSARTKPLSSEAHCVCESHWYQYIHCLVSGENIFIFWSLEKRVVRVVGWLHVCCEGAHPCPRIRFYRCWGMIGRVGRGSSKGVCRVSCKLWDQLGPVSQGGSMIPANFTTNS